MLGSSYVFSSVVSPVSRYPNLSRTPSIIPTIFERTYGWYAVIVAFKFVLSGKIFKAKLYLAIFLVRSSICSIRSNLVPIFKPKKDMKWFDFII